MNSLLIYIAIFLGAYGIDMSTAFLHRKLKPNNFKRIESNQLFSACIEQKGIIKGIGTYIILSSTTSIILFLSVYITSRIIFSSTIYQSIMFSFLLLAVAHVFGTITNLLALLKKEQPN